MTIDECKKYLPNRWAEIIQQDPLLMEIFEEHDYDLEEEAVPPFLFQVARWKYRTSAPYFCSLWANWIKYVTRTFGN